MKKSREKFNLQLMMAILLTVSGIVLLFSGFWIDPQGKIDRSVLVAFGEIMTFAGALFGVDYSYKIKQYGREHNNKLHVERDDRE